MKIERFWYLASPYSKYPGGIEVAYRVACLETARLIQAGVPVYSPIAHSHGPAIHGDINPYDHEIWLPACKPMMDSAGGAIMLMARGWKESYGMRKEMEAFAEARKPILWMRPGHIPAELS